MKSKIQINKDLLKPGDIIFTGEKHDFISKVIAFIMLKVFNKPYYRYVGISHTALYVGNGMLVEMVWTGFRINLLSKYNLKKYIVAYGRSKTAIDKSKLDGYLEEKKDVKYGFLTLVNLFFKKIFNLIGLKRYTDLEDDRMICSEFIVNLYRELYEIDLGDGLYSCDVTPLDLFNNKGLEITVL